MLVFIYVYVFSSLLLWDSDWSASVEQHHAKQLGLFSICTHPSCCTNTAA